MPITDFGAYKTTGDEFDVHWLDVNADRAANTLPDFELNDGYKIADLQADGERGDASDVENAVVIDQQRDDVYSALGFHCRLMFA